VGLLLGLSSIVVPWSTLFLSVVLYIVVPVIAAQLWRRSLLARGGDAALAQTLRKLQPISLIALHPPRGATPPTLPSGMRANDSMTQLRRCPHFRNGSY